MKLSKESHNLLETFFREYLKDEKFILLPVTFYSGSIIGFFAKLFSFYAITFGQKVFLAPHTIRKDSKGRLIVSGWLIAHECCHVMQYKREGFLRFLFLYVKEYLTRLKNNGKIKSDSHINAYMQMIQELEAVEVENAYLIWRKKRLFSL